MSYATVMVHVQDYPGGLSRLRVARDLADRFGAALYGLGAEALTPITTAPVVTHMPPTWYAAMERETGEHLDKAEEAFKAATVGMSGEAIWARTIDMPLSAVTTAARAADLIVANVMERDHLDPTWDAPCGDLVMMTGRPVLVTPAGAAPFQGDKVLVAWKDTREARRALADALPFLERAKAVRVVEVCDEVDSVDARARVDDVVRGLGRHGIAAEAATAVHSESTGATILGVAGRFEADLIVAGAYGHSRLGEFVFGGATRDLIWQTPTYLMISH